MYNAQSSMPSLPQVGQQQTDGLAGAQVPFLNQTMANTGKSNVLTSSTLPAPGSQVNNSVSQPAGLAQTMASGVQPQTSILQQGQTVPQQMEQVNPASSIATTVAGVKAS